MYTNEKETRKLKVRKEVIVVILTLAICVAGFGVTTCDKFSGNASAKETSADEVTANDPSEENMTDTETDMETADMGDESITKDAPEAMLDPEQNGEMTDPSMPEDTFGPGMTDEPTYETTDPVTVCPEPLPPATEEPVYVSHPSKPDKSTKPSKPDKTTKPSKPSKPDKTTKPSKPDKTTKPSKPDKVKKPSNPEPAKEAKPYDKNVDTIDLSVSWEDKTEYFDSDEQYKREATVSGTSTCKYINHKVFEADNGDAIIVVHFEETIKNSKLLNKDGKEANDKNIVDYDQASLIGYPSAEQAIKNKDTGETVTKALVDPNVGTLDEPFMTQVKEWMVSQGVDAKDLEGKGLKEGASGWSINTNGNGNYDDNGRKDAFQVWKLARTDVPVTINVPVNGRASSATPAVGSVQHMTIED